MIDILIFQNEYARLEVGSPNNMFIQLTWLQHASGEPLRRVMMMALEHARAKGLHLWLIDMRRIHYTTMEDQLWTVKEYLPTFDLRLHYRTACVVSLHNLDLIPDVLVQEALQHDPILTGRMEMEVFHSIEDAKSWLLL
ncbi:hypothetical protein ACMA1I_17600 [Pontibacter sp. 13R65]|uniref:hypothetical protein n=1 Tax=Pontibacter sp. 13R65 TaxID=3127458 RepID=UPI00301CCF81